MSLPSNLLLSKVLWRHGLRRAGRAKRMRADRRCRYPRSRRIEGCLPIVFSQPVHVVLPEFLCKQTFKVFNRDRGPHGATTPLGPRLGVGVSRDVAITLPTTCHRTLITDGPSYDTVGLGQRLSHVCTLPPRAASWLLARAPGRRAVVAGDTNHKVGPIAARSSRARSLGRATIEHDLINRRGAK